MGKIRELNNELGNLEESIRKAIKYCQKHDILNGFLETHGSEVLNMLLTEWNWDDALAVRFEEGLEEGMERGREEGREEGYRQIAMKALSKGLPLDVIKDITGFDLETIQKISSQLNI